LHFADAERFLIFRIWFPSNRRASTPLIPGLLSAPPPFSFSTFLLWRADCEEINIG
jgi:hypothetical protein